ncbi:hypothetical protein [Plantibacter sp. YIM 135249]|uniref:hypothetical protein n=1 Tax=Plantibacter sp. YIM 135249 TaxID=3423918 RepID=UPI003D3568E7
MTLWSDRYVVHPLWPEVDAVRAQLNALDISGDDRNGQAVLSYVGIVVELLERRRSESDPLEVTPAMLTSTQNATSNLTSTLTNIGAGVWPIDMATAATDSVMDTLASWPVVKPSRYLSGIQAAIEAFANRVAEAVSRVEVQSQALESRIGELDTRETELSTSVDTERQRIREAVADFKVEANQAIQHVTDSQESVIDELRAGWTATDAAYRNEAEAVLKQLHKHEDSARKTVHATTALVVATDYGRYARNKTFAAWVCDIAAAFVGAAGVTAIIWHLFTIDPDSDSNVGLSLTRLAASLGTLGIAALLGRRGQQHHAEARAAKRTDLALRRVMPFIANLPEDEQQAIVLEFTERVFIRGDLEASTTAEASLRERLAAIRTGRGKPTQEA